MALVKIYDTTLRDGTQMEGISLSVEDKLKITLKLDKLGVHYIEGGWPGSNQKDMEYFKRVQDMKFNQAVVTAFGSTRRKGISPDQDANLKSIIESGVKAATIFGKSWDLHVVHALRTTLDENLKMIEDSVAFLKENGLEVFYDAEHFFDGYKANPEYALQTICAAAKAGADAVVLCDTNGGTMPHDLMTVIEKVKEVCKAPLGIHAHNDSEMAVANSILAVNCGITQVQGTMNGYGERCGNANLCSIIPNLKLKMKFDCITDDQLESLTETSRYINEIANLRLNDHQPYVGNSAFAHKAGIHVSAILRHPETYEHIRPELVGNNTRVLVSELAGISNLIYKAQELNFDLTQDSPKARKVLDKLKDMEHQGYQFEGAEGSFELLVRKAFDEFPKFFDVDGFRIIVEKQENGELISEATIKVTVNGEKVHTAAEGDGPVNALDNALRKALEHFYPKLKEIKLNDYKVRVLNGKVGTEAKVRVLAESSHEGQTWGTVGVSTNIIEASWEALLDSTEYGLLVSKAEPTNGKA